MNETNDFLGFDPSQLSVFNQDEQKTKFVDPLIYNTNPDLASKEVSKEGYYRATIKIIYNPFKYADSIVEQQSYGLVDTNGFFSVVSSLTDGDKNCPVFKAWKKCHFARQKDGSFNSKEDEKLWKQSAKEEEGGRALFDKRFARYVTIQVLEDKNHPEQEGKYLIWKLPADIWKIIEQKQKPTNDEKAPIPVMDFLFGRSFEIEVKPGPDDPNNPQRRNRERSYMVEMSEDVVPVINPDGSPVLSTSEQPIFDAYVDAVKKIWKTKDKEERERMMAELNADANTIEFRKIYSRVLTQIKELCPNVSEHMGFKPWTPEVTKRVNDWITVVLSGNNPSTVSVSTIGTTPTKDETPTNIESDSNQTETQTSVPVETQSTATPADSDDDLPF